MAAAKKLKIEDLKFYSIKEVSEITSYHVNSLYRLIAKGILPSVKIRGKRLVSSAQLKKFLEASISDGELEG